MPRRARRKVGVLATRAPRAVAVALAVASVSLGLAAAAPAAPPGGARQPKAAADGGERSDPDNLTSLSAFMVLVGKGNEKYAAKDYPAAIDLYRKAIQLSPKNAFGPYLLGEAHLATNNLAEAEAAFKAAAEISYAKTPPLVRSNILFAVADCYEREKKWVEARAAWQTYTEHAAKLGIDGGAHPQSGVARLKAIDDYMKLDKDYAIVRQRIAAEKSDAGSDAGKAATKK